MLNAVITLLLAFFHPFHFYPLVVLKHHQGLLRQTFKADVPGYTIIVSMLVYILIVSSVQAFTKYKHVKQETKHDKLLACKNCGRLNDITSNWKQCCTYRFDIMHVSKLCSSAQQHEGSAARGHACTIAQHLNIYTYRAFVKKI